MPKWVTMSRPMAPRMAAASRLMGMRRGCSTVRRTTAKTITTSTTIDDASMIEAERVRDGAPKSASENDGNSPCTSVSPVPIVMRMKPQKIRKWYLLPSALTKRGKRLAGRDVFSTTFFWPKKYFSTESTRSSVWSIRGSGGPPANHPDEAPEVHANMPRAAATATAKSTRFMAVHIVARRGPPRLFCGICRTWR